MWFIVIIVTLFSFSDWSFAADDSMTLLDVTTKWLHVIVSILSFIWIFFAQWVWEFLTNKWVYGEFIWLDSILWKYWNVIKNIANFWLWFYFIYTIFKWLIDSKTDVVKKLKDTLLWILIAWIWIQTSWFMVAAIIDTSTITLVAVSSLPSQIVSNSHELKYSFDYTLRHYFWEAEDALWDFEKWVGISLFSSDRWAFNFISVNKELPLDEKITEDQLFDIIMPNGNSVSWPLHYLWLAILDSTSLASLNSASENGLKGTLFNMTLQSLTTVIYSLEMMVLFVVVVMRVVYIWVFIVLSPIVFLLRCIKKSDKNLKIEFLDGLTKHFNLSSFFWNVFKPAIIVLGFSLAIIFVTVMNSIIQSSAGKTLDIWWVKTYSNSDITGMDSDTVGLTIRGAWKTILEFIMCIITVVLVYQIIKIAVSMWDGKDFVSTKIQSLQKNVTGLMSSIPIMPVAWYDKNWRPKTRYLSTKQVFGINSEGEMKLNDSIIWKKIGWYQWKVTGVYDDQNKIINSWFGDNVWYLSQTEKKDISEAMRKSNTLPMTRLEDTLGKINGIKTDDWKWMRLNPQTAQNGGWWIDEFKQRLNTANANDISSSYPVWKEMVKSWQSEPDSSKRTLETLFKDSRYVKAYADFFGLWSVSWWDELKNRDISKNSESKEKSEEE